MTETSAPAAAAWTCPFCPLSCDHLGVRSGSGEQPLALAGGDCERATRGLARFSSRPPTATAEIGGQPCELDAAIDAAARLLAGSRQPLMAGLGTDVAGARALYPLACATGAIVDATGGEALMHGLRALQDRGQFTATLAEVRTRADLIVFVGGLPTAQAPLIGLRCGIGDPQVAARHVVVLGPGADDGAVLAGWAGPGVTVETVALEGDLFSTLSLLLAAVARRPLPALPAGLRALAERLHAARYGVLVGAPARLPAQGALAVEAVHQIIGHLNRSTRAAALWVGGGHGAATANQVFAWLSGLPLRSRAGPHGLEHEPLVFDGARLLAAGAVDALVWVSTFDADAAPPPNALPLLVLGPPEMAAAARRPGALFIAVSTPGIGSAGHLFRTDGTVLMPLTAARPDTLPTVAEVAQRLLAALRTEARA